jgi:two-component system sensor histidine kinase TctE
VVKVLSGDQGPVPVTVTVAESTRAREALARTILTRSAVRLAALILSAAAVVWIVTTLALRPLGRISQSIALRRPDDLSPITADMPQELGGLVGSVNGFMARLDAAVQALKGFASHANHQIRTPLATARTEIALAGRDGTASPALERADAALIRAERVLAQLLLLARVQAAGQKPPSEPVDLARMAQDIAAELIPQAAARGQDMGYDGPGALTITAAPVLLEEAIRNLADNAIRHAGEGATITLRVGHDTDRPALTVEDTGPGLCTRPTTSADMGHGLGLLIVRQIALAIGTDLTLAPGPGGSGLAAQLRWPAVEN